jgi:hypothetical protein
MTEPDSAENDPLVRLEPSDLAEIRTAIHKGWELPDKIRRVLPAQVLGILADKNTTVKEKLKAAEILQRMVEKTWALVPDETGRVQVNEQIQKMLDSVLPPVPEEQSAQSNPSMGDEG